MPIQGYLKPEIKAELQKRLKEENHADIRERVLILLLLNDGKTQQEIADFLGCSLRKVAYWCVHGDPENLESLKDERMKGNAKKVTQEYIDKLLETVDTEPKDLGYDFGRWTTARLATYLKEQTGIQLSSRQVSRILAQKKYVYICAKASLEERQDPEKRAEFKKRMSRYIEIAKENPSQLQVWFWDECGFGLQVIRRKIWGRRGKRKKVPGHRRRGRINVMGALRLSDKKRRVDFVRSGNGENFYKVLKSFYEEVQQEWEEQGNNRNDFETSGPKIIIVLDNASFHKNKDFMEKIALEMPNIVLEFLPPYSPDYNLIELVWHSAKEYIANCLFESIEHLEALLHQLLNEGELQIKWGRKIKNKGNSIYAI